MSRQSLVKCSLPPWKASPNDLRKVKNSNASVRKFSFAEAKMRGKSEHSNIPSFHAINSTKAISVYPGISSTKEPGLCNSCKDSLCPCCKKGFGQKESEDTKIPEKESHQNKMLTRELPLYDDNFHLLGYLAKGTVIKGPYCQQSYDSFREIVNNDGNDETKPNNEYKCLPECKKAVMEAKFAIPYPRWVNRTQYDNATLTV